VGPDGSAASGGTGAGSGGNVPLKNASLQCHTRRTVVSPVLEFGRRYGTQPGSSDA